MNEWNAENQKIIDVMAAAIGEVTEDGDPDPAFDRVIAEYVMGKLWENGYGVTPVSAYFHGNSQTED